VKLKLILVSGFPAQFQWQQKDDAQNPSGTGKLEGWRIAGYATLVSRWSCVIKRMKAISTKKRRNNFQSSSD
jgi:hypothetical protein